MVSQVWKVEEVEQAKPQGWAPPPPATKDGGQRLQYKEKHMSKKLRLLKRKCHEIYMCSILF